MKHMPYTLAQQDCSGHILSILRVFKVQEPLSNSIPDLNTMHTARPTTRLAQAAFKLGEGLLDPDIPSLGFLAGRNPTDPFIACE